MGLVFTSGYPRDLPERADGVLPMANCEFDKLYSQATAPLRGGDPQVVNLGADLWKIAYTTVSFTHSGALQFQAWLDSLDGGLKLFKAWDPRLRYPQAYPVGFAGLKVGGDDFTGVCAISNVAVTLDEITLSGLPNGFKLTIGDMISLTWSGTQLLHRILASATADGFGQATIAIRPRLPISFVKTGVTVTLVKPWCLAVLDASSVRGPFKVGQSGPITFSATQKI